ncbi:tetratricopeptide repeat protein 39C-like [Oppia nitens]|uniref:tetratricopeptide repeat protein 39C-like n=1 Tax=Oppia nitens TaxID=1686743 RepID=UPI0023D9A21F|nr:tetratricopeptide repeat protein 39C-like [Oppia nitens]
MDKCDIDRAHEDVNSFTEVTNQYRSNGFLPSFLHFIKSPNYQKYSDSEAHSEILNGIASLMSAFVSALGTTTIIDLIRTAFRLQRFINTLKAGKCILKSKTKWESKLSQVSYESIYRLSSGLSHLFISYMPPKLLRIINLLGVNGSETVGFIQINRTAFMFDGMCNKLAQMFLIVNNVYIEPYMGFQSKNSIDCQMILKENLNVYSNSVVFMTVDAKYIQLRGDLEEAIKYYTKLITDYSFDVSLKWFHFELMFSNALICNFNESVKYAELIRKGSRQSPAFTTYCEAVVRYVIGKEENNTQELETAIKLLEIVPTVRVRYFGKSATFEKASVLSAEKFRDKDNCPVLPDMEILYQANLFQLIKDKPIYLNRFMDRVKHQISIYSNDLKTKDYLDNYLTALFYKAVIHKFLGEYDECKKCLTTIIDDTDRFQRETSIPPQAVFEMGLVEMELNNTTEAKQWINKCLHDFSGYVNENFVHIRAYAALRHIGVSSDKQRVDDSLLPMHFVEPLNC